MLHSESTVIFIQSIFSLFSPKLKGIQVTVTLRQRKAVNPPTLEAENKGIV